MTTEENYVERLEKIIDMQDNLLSQMDARFGQQNALNEHLFKQNKHLEEEIQKHEDLAKDMNKTITQQKNDVDKLKKEVEEQLEIQKKLHNDYGDVINQLTDNLEEEKKKNEILTKIQSELKAEIEKLKKIKSSQTEKPSDKSDKNSYYDNLTQKIPKKCPKCGVESSEGDLFCQSCGTKL